VHSSISSSNDRAPAAPYLKLWGLALLLFLAVLAGLELFWRSSGQLASVTDDMFLWSYHRSRVYSQDGVKRLVILGSSRSMLGIVPEVLKREFPSYEVVHLAVDGHNPYASFRDLAEDERFDGILIVDMTEKSFFPDNQDAQQAWVDYYHREWSSWGRIDKLLNMHIRVLLQSRLVMFNSVLNPRMLIANNFHLQPAYYSFRPDRYRPAFYYDRLTPEELLQARQRRLEIVSRTERAAPGMESEFVQILNDQVHPLVAKLQSRGGEVVFLRMPTCDQHWAIDQANFPLQDYWAKIQPVTGARAIHFSNTEGLADFECPDTSHLDATDAPEFTARLSQVLKNRLFADTANLGD
jgi:hypothetical protein